MRTRVMEAEHVSRKYSAWITNQKDRKHKKALEIQWKGLNTYRQSLEGGERR